MTLIKRKEIEELNNLQSTNCISIFIPTHRAGKSVLEGKDALELKNQLKAIKNKLQNRGLSPVEIKKLVAPIQELLDDKQFWRHQSDGLALFLADGFFTKYVLPIHFESFNHLAESFYMKPLLPLFAGDGFFFVLALELEEVNLYEMTRHSITDIIVHDLIPSQMEETVGYDSEQKNLQFRTPQAGHGAATFHGHAEADRDRDNEISRFFKSIDKGLMTILHDERQPMIVACQDYQFPLYQAVNSYSQLLDDHISGTPSNLDKHRLHELAWEQMESFFDKTRKEKIALYKQFHDSEKTSSDIKEILPASLDGKIDTLFVQNRADIWGTYHPEKRQVELNEHSESRHVSLLNKVAIQTFLKGGNVYLSEKEEMPNAQSKVNALYRY